MTKWLMVLMLLGMFVACSEPNTPVSGNLKSKDIALQDGKFVSPRQVRAVVGEKK